MINRKFFIFLSTVILIFSISISAVEKNNINITTIENKAVSEIRFKSTLSAADSCIVRHDIGIAYKIGNWVQGNELYKSYLDPEQSCINPYPYSVTEIVMPLWFDSATTITVAVDVEKVDLSDPNCPFPDSIIGISSVYSVTVDDSGLYFIWIPLDEPVIVNEPFFAGFFFGEIDSNNIPSVITDNNAFSSCESYNIWDDSIGFVDLMDYGFPGQLVLYASGIPGGGPTDPDPQISILSPANNSNAYKSVNIWANETSGSSIIDYVSFAYASDTDFIEIGRDYDGTRSFRDGINSGNNANGYNINWDFSLVPEGTYNIRVTSVDTLGKSASDEMSLFLEPTPPIAEITTPSFGAQFCPQFDILMSSNDEDLTSVTMSYRRSNPDFSIGAKTLDLANFESYYSPAIAAALAMHVFADRGHTYVIKEGFNKLTPTQMAQKLATFFALNADSGATDEKIYTGLQEFNSVAGRAIKFEYQHFPNYLDLRTSIELNGDVVMAGLGGTSNSWLLIDGFNGTVELDNTYKITISNPLTALIDTIQFRHQAQSAELFYNGEWQPLEVIITMNIAGWDKQLIEFGFDIDRNDGWAVSWTPSNLWQNYDYYIQSDGVDGTLLHGYNTTMYMYDCTQFYTPGDFNNDGITDIADLEILIAYFTVQGLPPLGGDARADTNCDGYLNITDIIYYANYIFGLAPTPCY